MRTLVTAAVMGVIAVAAPPALAHGTFVDSRPLPGVEVGGVVDEVALLLPEALVPDAGSITVIGPGGGSVPAGDVEYPVETVIRLPIDPLTEPGIYEIAFTVPATDGFVFEGSYTFEYLPEAQPLDPLPYGRVDRTEWLMTAAVAAAAAVASLVLIRSGGFRRWWHSRGR